VSSPPPIRYPEAAPPLGPRRPPSPVRWTCARCQRPLYPVGLHTCDEHGRAVDADGRTVTAGIAECAGLFAGGRGQQPPACRCDVDDSDHDQVEVTDL
jgi:hypothetical protein